MGILVFTGIITGARHVWLEDVMPTAMPIHDKRARIEDQREICEIPEACARAIQLEPQSLVARPPWLLAANHQPFLHDLDVDLGVHFAQNA